MCLEPVLQLLLSSSPVLPAQVFSRAGPRRTPCFFITISELASQGTNLRHVWLFPLKVSFSDLESESESEVAQSCPTLSDPMDCSLPGSSIHGIFQARVQEWVAIAFSVSKSCEVAQLCPTLCDPWTLAHQAPPSMGFSRQGYWSGLPFPSPGDLPDPGIEPRSPTLQADALTSAPPGKPLNTRMQSLRKPPIETQNFRSKY